MVKNRQIGEEKEKGGCMIAHFMEERTDAVRRRRAACVGWGERKTEREEREREREIAE